MEDKNLKNLSVDTIVSEIRYGNHTPDECIIMIDEFAIGFANWLEKLTPSQRVSVWSKNGEHSGLFTMDNEQLLDKYKQPLQK